MSARKTFGGVLVGALATASVIAGTAPAHAAYVPDNDDTTLTPVSADLIGVGSDTSQHALKLLADTWNGRVPAPAVKLATYAATSGGDLNLPGGATIPRPNGSGSGKSRLYAPNDTPEIDFARSSSSLSGAEENAGLKQFPFAVDVLRVAVSASVASNAPATINKADLVKIYDGTYTNWNQIPGSATSGVIAPKIPQAGSGTRSFFEAQLKAANGGNAVTLAPSVVAVQEHDDTSIKNDPNAIAPFSAGRAGLLGNTLRLVGGDFEAKRALYNVVRGTDVAKPEITAVFGPDGFLCSDAAEALIKQAGFDQLARPIDGGVCGVQTTSATSNFTTGNEPVATTASVSGTSTGAGKADVKATIAGSKTPEGTVTFSENGVVVAANVAVVGGAATAKLSGLAAGTHTYKAVFTPKAGSVFQPSEATGTVTVKTIASLSESFPAKAKRAKKVKGSVSVALAGTTTPATGAITVKLGSKVVGTGTVSGGVAKVALKGLKKGKNKLVATWGGDALAPSTTLAFTIKLK
ncbi:PstS family phosphate ABC transporter substrate-binding protein [Nocardioides daeguensis]|uniref:PBP domain-containing protein n=1 Tax=Nocardioides daeguensis TaxID=908359 RepID=A0ABP6W7M6_9ACTN|nr:substrate-binding domain-containing protein [Nocardioides daeguensis]MBV6729327.1 Ig-like domain repeat protein [Nocardioides daeguensis]MCR1774303.1 Ig-like domain repeat protein [Nocardioides daeguensis]